MAFDRASIVALTCDSYPISSIRRQLWRPFTKLGPGGLLVVVDFERVAGKSTAFIMGHVRAGKEVFLKEIEAAGFKLLDQSHVSDLQENYVLRFAKR